MGDDKYSSHSLDEVSDMIHNTISAYESKIDKKCYVEIITPLELIKKGDKVGSSEEIDAFSTRYENVNGTVVVDFVAKKLDKRLADLGGKTIM
ncbi:hypothetical protein L6452_34708 [Arctium lappa]|uniref:Uncharacterized protein n=1 Tax=Arctium lappa TaxID=4217 RepID=A0ACB8YKH5_ARCLA|nr:hypothetical protein L6452_34708 [Arctium lappa]